MPRDGVLLSEFPARLGELVAVVREAGEPLGVQGVDRLGTAAILTEDRRFVCGVHEPALIESDLELARLRPDDGQEQTLPAYWHDVWIGDADPALGLELLVRLAERLGGRLVLSESVDELLEF